MPAKPIVNELIPTQSFTRGQQSHSAALQVRILSFGTFESLKLPEFGLPASGCRAAIRRPV